MEKFVATPQIEQEIMEAHALIMACHTAIQSLGSAMHGISHALDLAAQLLPARPSNLQDDPPYKSHQSRLDTVADLLNDHNEARQDIIKAGHALAGLGLALELIPAVELQAHEESTAV